MEAPRRNGEDSEHMLWKEIRINSPDSPVFNLREKVVDEVLDELREGCNLVTTDRYYQL